MRYFANPSTVQVREAQTAGRIDVIETPRQGNQPVPGATWCADNGCFTERWDQDQWWRFLVDNAHRASSCAFAVAPDVVADAWATQMRSMPWLPQIRALGYPAAYVAQDGARANRLPWHAFDVLFLGGTTEWKLGPTARAFTFEAKRRGKRVHMGRVNSLRRLRYAQAIGCDSADGTFVTYAPDANLPTVLAWVREVTEQPALWNHEGAVA